AGEAPGGIELALAVADEDEHACGSAHEDAAALLARGDGIGRQPADAVERAGGEREVAAPARRTDERRGADASEALPQALIRRHQLGREGLGRLAARGNDLRELTVDPVLLFGDGGAELGGLAVERRPSVLQLRHPL